MSEYKRLASGNFDGLKQCVYYDYYIDGCRIGNSILKCKECPHKEYYDRLKELEDKLESGQLVELPCKVGDTVYCIEYFCNANGCSNDKQTSCCGCSEMLERERKKQTYVISEKKFRLEDLSEINKTLYITKKEAEARLKELKKK